MRIVHPADPAIHIVIEDLYDPSVFAETQKVVRDAFREHALPGAWIVVIAASEMRGRWEVGLRGPGRRHFFSFASSPGQVPEFVEHYLRRTLDRLGGASP